LKPATPISISGRPARIFALVSLEGDPRGDNLKCDTGLALELRARYLAVRPGYHQGALVPRRDGSSDDNATCRPHRVVADVAATGAPGGVWVVVNEQRVVLGRPRAAHVDRDDRRTAEEVMEPGPATIRPDDPAAETTERMPQPGGRPA
jgi:hypothetical protein